MGERATQGAKMYMSLSSRILNNLKLRFKDQPIDRVITCWEDFASQKKCERYLDEKKEIYQTADCFVNGLNAVPFYDKTLFPWVKPFEESYEAIRDELRVYNQKHENSVGNEVGGEWVAARDVVGAAYGLGWKTLGLQDRNNWNEELLEDFPQTIKALKTLNIPVCEAFFARQGPQSTIQPHSDKNNFIITCHLPLDVPEGECYIRVGNQDHYWKNGEVCVFDTSIIHSTENKSVKPRYILLLRLWHPQLTSTEIEALR